MRHWVDEGREVTDEQFAELKGFVKQHSFTSELVTIGVDIFVEDVPEPQWEFVPHPRLVVNEADLADLRARCLAEPHPVLGVVRKSAA